LLLSLRRREDRVLPLPRWAWPFLLDKTCPICGTATSLDNVRSVGVKQINHRINKIKEGNAALIFEYACQNCNEGTLWIADPDDKNVSSIDIAKSILHTFEAHKNDKADYIQNKVSSSKITKREIQQLKQKLASIETYDEFLDYIGAKKPKSKKIRKKDEDKDK